MSRVFYYSKRMMYIAGIGVFTGSAISTYGLTLVNTVVGLAVLLASILYFYSYARGASSVKEVRGVFYILALLISTGALTGALLSGFLLASILTALGLILVSLVLSLIIERV